jgi:hypothetical protein
MVLLVARPPMPVSVGSAAAPSLLGLGLQSSYHGSGDKGTTEMAVVVVVVALVGPREGLMIEPLRSVKRWICFCCGRPFGCAVLTVQ